MILGTGIDIIEIERIQKAIDRWGEHFLKHVFTDKEITHVQKYKFPAQHYAVRFAAKEAVYKAMSDKYIGWKDIEILNDGDGKPYCIYHKNDFKHHILISLSHSQNYAVANAIIAQREAS